MINDTFVFNKIPNQEFEVLSKPNTALKSKIIIEKDNSYTLYDFNIKDNIGVGEFKEGYLFVVIYRKETNTNFTGKQIFKILYDFFLFFYQKMPLGIEVSWDFFSDNTVSFSNTLINSPIEIAAFQTWTGQRAKERGFDKATIIKLKFNQEKKGNANLIPKYAPVSVKFFK